MQNIAMVNEIERHVSQASQEMNRVEEIFTGRDTNPLYETGYGQQNAAEIFVCIEVKQILGRLAQLEIYLDDYKQQALGV